MRRPGPSHPYPVRIEQQRGSGNLAGQVADRASRSAGGGGTRLSM
ncbi:hypothetical protein ACQSSU_13915 [Micromonospora echinospora]